jgi:peptidoglycan DL-endopeptidase CwlO
VRSMPARRHVPRHQDQYPLSSQGDPRIRRRLQNSRLRNSRLRNRGWPSAVVLAGILALCAATIPGGVAQAAPASGNSSLNAILAEANRLSNEIDLLGQQYDGLKIQLGQARQEVALAKENAARDVRILAAYRRYIGDIAAEGYMTGGLDPSMQLLQSANPQTLLNRASIMTQLAQQNGAKVSLVSAAETAAQRSLAAAAQEQAAARKVSSAMAAKVARIQSLENFFNGEAFAKAEAIFEQTGHYPTMDIGGDTQGDRVVQFALSMLGKPYVWGGASPSIGFDCSGLVVWAYAQIGITLEHFTGDLWNEVVHIPYSEAQPGDLVFFYADIQHVGIYIGGGMMVDAPTFGQVVQIQPVSDDPLVGTGYVPGAEN